MIFELSEKTGFYPYDYHKNETIYRYDNIKEGYEPFYTVREYAFNLPVGSYLANNSVSDIVIGEPVFFERIKLSEREFINDPYETNFFLGKNEAKASIFIHDNYILFDKDLYDQLDEIGRTFIIYHEIGHLKYSSETDCDNFAKNMMLDEGFNPSQFLNFGSEIFCNNVYRLENLLKQSEKWKK